MEIRAADNRDLEAVRAIVFAALEEYGLSADCHDTDRDLADLEASYFQRGGVFEVLVDETGRIVGTVGVLPLREGVCELRKMYLIPEVRGRGLGRRLLERALAWAEQAGFRTMELETAGVLKEAIGLYHRYGFEPVPRDVLTGRCDQVMEKELGAGD